MNVFVAGNEEGIPVYRREFTETHHVRSLWSFFKFLVGSVKEEAVMTLKQRETGAPVELFLDSGAYSAFSKGAELNLDDYIAFIQKHRKVIKVYANLDVIGDPAATWENQKKMEAAGLKPLPCYHYGEPVEYLRRYMDGYEYIAFGGMVPIPRPTLVNWLDDMFSRYICDERGLPRVKVHGFGLSSVKMFLRYPWFSVDSTTWVLASRMGKILIPRTVNGAPVFTVPPVAVTVSSRPEAVNTGTDHFDTLGKMTREFILAYVQEKGFQMGASSFEWLPVETLLDDNTVNMRWHGHMKWHGTTVRDGKRLCEIRKTLGLCNDYRQRDMFNILYFQDVEANVPAWPWAFKVKRAHRGFGLLEAKG